jgi:glutamate dehydrogenase (NADP+)
LYDNSYMTNSIFDEALMRLDNAFQYSDIHQEAVEKLKYPKAILQVSMEIL